MESLKYLEGIPNLSSEDREMLSEYSLKALQHAYTRLLKYPHTRNRAQFLNTLAQEFEERNKASHSISPRSTSPSIPKIKPYAPQGTRFTKGESISMAEQIYNDSESLLKLAKLIGLKEATKLRDRVILNHMNNFI